MIRRVMSRRKEVLVLCCSMVADDEVWIDRGALGYGGAGLAPGISRDSASLLTPVATASIRFITLLI